MRAVAAILAMLAAYPWVGYPLLVAAFARLRAPAPRRSSVPASPLPSAVILCVAHNEERVIAGKVGSALAQDYPAERLSFLLVLDDCTDATEERFLDAARPASDRFAVMRLPQRSGKAEGLAAAWPRLPGEIVVLTDANTMFEPHTVSALVGPFADPLVGAVAGVKRIATRSGGAVQDENEGLYWRLENWLKAQESAIGISVAADGGCWAVRRNAWDGTTPSMRSDDLWGSVQVLRQDAIDPRQLARTTRQNLDDLWGSAQILRGGSRTVFEPAAQGIEFAAPSIAAEFLRKRRTALGLTQTMPYLLWLLDPRRGRQAWGFVSHKVARLLTPWLMVGHVLALASAGSAGRVLATLEVLGASTCVLAALQPSDWLGPVKRPARALGYFLIALSASALGTAEAIVGTKRARTAYWNPTSRDTHED